MKNKDETNREHKFEKLQDEMNSYLSKFKDKNGDEIDDIVLAVFIERYCNLYIEEHKGTRFLNSLIHS